VKRRFNYRRKDRTVEWYYAVGGERFGPLDQEAFDLLVSQGRITGVTLVWRDGLQDWVQYQFLAHQAPADPGDIPPVLAQCSQCSRRASSDDMVQYQDHWVCSECKDTFYQRVREGSFSPQDPTGAGRYRFAGFWIRVGASILDGLILAVPNVLLQLMFIGVVSSGDPDAIAWMQVFVTLIPLAIAVTYMTWFVGKYAATPGKMACGLKIIVSDGRPVSYARAFGRYWAMVLSFLIPYFSFAIAVGIAMALILVNSGGSGPGDVGAVLGGAALLAFIVGLLMAFPLYMAGMTKQKCALHDFICNTRVIRAR
jgi:hypothetical protein